MLNTTKRLRSRHLWGKIWSHLGDQRVTWKKLVRHINIKTIKKRLLYAWIKDRFVPTRAEIWMKTIECILSVLIQTYYPYFLVSAWTSPGQNVDARTLKMTSSKIGILARSIAKVGMESFRRNVCSRTMPFCHTRPKTMASKGLYDSAVKDKKDASIKVLFLAISVEKH